MHQIAFGGRTLPGTAGAAHSTPPGPLAALGKGGEGKGYRRGGERMERDGWNGRGMRRRKEGLENGKVGTQGEGGEGEGKAPHPPYKNV